MSQKNQTSSLKAAKIKSDCASGMYPNFCRPLPYPFQKNPHHQMAANACSFCHHTHCSVASEFQLMKYNILSCRYANLSLTNDARLPKSSAQPAPQIHTIVIFFQSIPAYKAMTIPVIHITRALPKSGIKQKIIKNIIFITI